MGNSASDGHTQKALSSQGRIETEASKSSILRRDGADGKLTRATGTGGYGFAVYYGAVACTHVTPFLRYSKVPFVAGS